RRRGYFDPIGMEGTDNPKQLPGIRNFGVLATRVQYLHRYVPAFGAWALFFTNGNVTVIKNP
ncbi:MAG: hypothetical protein KAS85_11665, partial [Rhodobacteraceae bacterium]|nr:hypothetical protein [Paracoccaceae bacterium]